MRLAALLSILLTFIPVAVSAAASAELARFEGGWGFVSSEPKDSWWGAGLRGGDGACGAPKQLKIDIREETSPDGSRELLMRFHPDQLTGAVVTSISAARLTTNFLGESSVFELRKDSHLVITHNGTRLLFKRC